MVEPGALSAGGEHPRITDVSTFVEVRGHEGLSDGALQFRRQFFDELEQSMGTKCVGTKCSLHVECNSFCRSRCSDLLENLLCAFGPPESFCVRLRNGCRRVGGGIRVELIGPPAHLDAQVGQGAAQVAQRPLETALTDVAPRAYDVGDDFYPHCCHDRGMQSADVTATFCATLVDEWLRLGASTCMIAPGSRSTPMALAIASAKGLRVHVFHDERSASFAALGAAKACDQPVLVLCTSGTAAVNFHPAVVEASYADVPLIVLTADRPPELQGVGAPQTIDQKYLYGSAVRAYIDAGVADDDRRDDWRRLARRAFRAAVTERPGPVHVNLPFREPLVGSAGKLPAVGDDQTHGQRRAKQLGTETLAKVNSRLKNKRGVIIAGARGVPPRAAKLLSDALKWPVLADPTSGCRTEGPHAIRHADALLRDSEIAKRLRPESVLRFGALPASKVVNSWLRDTAAEVTTVSGSPYLIDPDRTTSLHLVTNAEALCTDLAPLVAPCDQNWLQDWCVVEQSARRVVGDMLDDETRLSEPGVARCVVASLPTGSRFVVSSSMPIRDVEWYGGSCEHLTVLSNRGANGIDGVVSTAVGVALETGQTTGLLIGDIAFLHDSNGLIGLARRGADVR
ncbi:MAG: 2-succinyl-5-enolpyruvyl-6-hydroxy-3-cyclohexene-carboxylic-acid synthase, partial [Actinomycetota bacterium]